MQDVYPVCKVDPKLVKWWFLGWYKTADEFKTDNWSFGTSSLLARKIGSQTKKSHMPKQKVLWYIVYDEGKTSRWLSTRDYGPVHGLFSKLESIHGHLSIKNLHQVFRGRIGILPDRLQLVSGWLYTLRFPWSSVLALPGIQTRWNHTSVRSKTIKKISAREAGFWL